MLKINHRLWSSELKAFCDLILNRVTCLSHFPSDVPSSRNYALHSCPLLSHHSGFILLPLYTLLLALPSLHILNSAILQSLAQLPHISKIFSQPQFLFIDIFGISLITLSHPSPSIYLGRCLICKVWKTNKPCQIMQWRWQQPPGFLFIFYLVVRYASCWNGGLELFE